MNIETIETHKDLNKDTYIYFLTHFYDNPNCSSLEEFYEDVNILTSIKRLVLKYKKNKSNKSVNIKLLLNHVVILYNLFESSEFNIEYNVATRLLFYKIDESNWDILKTILIFLNRCPEYVHNVEGKTINLNTIDIDPQLLNLIKENI